MKVVDAGIRKGALGFGAREDVSVVAVVYLEGTFSGGGVYAVIVGECREG